ncbi:MAG: peptidoglycan DD-metalloendopeptidase family protein [Pseudomonadota bacterium]|nr:peptidoglycan DD-metalloendopeptidase family protein [Pseudomonadota bacterium]
MNRRLRHMGVAAALAALFCAGAAQAAGEAKDSTQAKAKLAAVRARIADLTARLGNELKQRDMLSGRLREAELGITAKRRRLESLRLSQAAAERHRTELRAAQTRAESTLQAERAALAVQVRAAYMIGRQERLKLLLNQSNPTGLGRTLTYYHYFAEERTSKINVIREQVEHLEELRVQLARQTAELDVLASDARHEVGEVELARAARSTALAALTKQVASGNQELANLKREEQAVESLLADLARVLQDFPVDQTQDFDRLRGKLPWPVIGRVTAHYQEPHIKSSSGIRWNGVMIEAVRGAKVHAPFFGRVVYGDWLQGLGLLLIIAHSDGYMTLYGHAEVLYKSVGDWVGPGDVIAGLSDSASAAPQLYFEIRAGRKPVDPKIWLKPNP